MGIARCDQCGATSRLVHLYVQEPGLKRMDEMHCPDCHMPLTESEPLPGWPAGVAMVAMLAYGLFVSDAAWPYLLLILFPALTILHEFLHAIPVWLFGGRVFEIHVGGGKKPSWRIGGVKFAVTNWLVGGGFCAFALPPSARPWQRVVVIALPLVFHLAAGLMLLHVGFPKEDGGATVMQLFALINAFIFLTNIYPSDWSDGHQLVLLLRHGNAWAHARNYGALAGGAKYAIDEGRREDALRGTRSASCRTPRSGTRCTTSTSRRARTRTRRGSSSTRTTTPTRSRLRS